ALVRVMVLYRFVVRHPMRNGKNLLGDIRDFQSLCDRVHRLRNTIKIAETARGDGKRHWIARLLIPLLVSSPWRDDNGCAIAQPSMPTPYNRAARRCAHINF